jgi:hypothetical protein
VIEHDTFCDEGEFNSYSDSSCNCGFIAVIREDQNNRIIKLVTDSQVINPDQKYFLLKAIKGEQK